MRATRNTNALATCFLKGLRNRPNGCAKVTASAFGVLQPHGMRDRGEDDP
jgi:hypothetical protein